MGEVAFTNALRQSIQLGSGSAPRKIDYDLRNNNYLSSLRKLFEEFRTICEQGEIARGKHELNGEAVFPDHQKNFDGSVRKEDFVYTMLEKEMFTLDRTEVVNIASLMLNIANRTDRGMIDLDELQFSYKSYLKYQELIEARIIDLFEKFKLSISKVITEVDDFVALASDIINRSVDCKITVQDLKGVLQDKHAVFIRDALYDQLASYFDLDRAGQIFIGSLCAYLRDPSLRQLNFFKVNPGVLTGQICDYVRNCIEREQFTRLENEFAAEIQATKSPPEDTQKFDMVNIYKEDTEPPIDLLLTERINATLF